MEHEHAHRAYKYIQTLLQTVSIWGATQRKLCMTNSIVESIESMNGTDCVEMHYILLISLGLNTLNFPP